jgi:hypothetical protein
MNNSILLYNDSMISISYENIILKCFTIFQGSKSIRLDDIDSIEIKESNLKKW